MNRYRKIIITIFIILIAIAFIQGGFSIPGQVTKELNYLEFRELMEKRQVASVKIDGYTAKGKLADGTPFVTNIPDRAAVAERLADLNIPVTMDDPNRGSFWLTLLGWAPVIILVLVVFLFMQQAQGGGSRVMNFGKSRARLHQETGQKVTFADVAGIDEAKEELEEIVEYLRSPRKFIQLGARIPKGVLLFGPPGTGKTLLARAVAGEAGVPFFSISGSDFVEMFVGVGASRVRDLFEQAKKHAPCIVFIDEIDAVGRQRGAGLGGGHDEREQTLNQLLVEMDGFGPNEGIIVIAATNRPDILDPALLRPGRFDRQITVDIPDAKGREEILKVHARTRPLEPTVDLSVLARRTTGFTGADLENMINEAALLAARRNLKMVTMNELEDAIDRVIAGPEKKNRIRTEHENRLVAYHEAGHALVAHLLEKTDPVHKVTIVPRGRAAGYTLALPEEDRYFATRGELLDKICYFLGGRVAEKIVFNEISTGAQNDLERVTRLARQMIMEYGMSDKLGHLTFGRKHDQVFLGRDLGRERDYSEDVASAIDQETRRMVDECFRRTEELLTKYLDKLHAVAEAVLEKETLDAAEFVRIVGIGKGGKPLDSVDSEE
ncbi:MAG: ATP-dependent metallopeptidase FtsH/Yme1/Tma family protein [Firmicutes bacterium]|nr:ATP-dependent metallopeptidase FtsH/Yme1/Tma family protein [Bacillota bacterium]HOB35241.1 ATP-dependent zinc metalloprotease FtsH [Bacillota bacterium]HPZ91235.1 ATP-dependent zinc metalloprotease FtsH [Bacillota bacterium]HQE02418.1 ATP-dependent zinc metalloprotease FtsH [Bacillota bacterium]